MGTLYVVATPIGNLDDFSPRAVETLKKVDLVLCEDTRVTKKLLDRYEIKTNYQAYHQHSKLNRVEEIIKKLEQGTELALVSDAGTPAISDPGNYLMQKIIESQPDTKIIAIPGASAYTSALSISAIKNDRFLFLGFLPHKKGRQTALKEIQASPYTVVLYESKHRIIKLLKELEEYLVGTPKKVEVHRELTKMHESSYRGEIAEIKKQLEDHPAELKGEFVVIIG